MARSGGGFWKGVFWVLFIEAVIGGCLALVVQFGGFPMGADANPSSFEAWGGHWTRHAWVNHHAPNVADPVPVNDKTLIAGAALYQQNCAVCHGGENYTHSPLHRGVYPGVPQFMRFVEYERKHPNAARHHESPAQARVHDDRLFYTIKHGIRFTGMPSWKYNMNDHQIWEVVNFMHNMGHLPPAVRKAWKETPMSPLAKAPTLASVTATKAGKKNAKQQTKK